MTTAASSKEGAKKWFKEPNYLIIAYDHKDSNALERRMEAREAHLNRAQFFREEGNLIVGGAITDESGKMVGSCLLVHFDTKAQVEEFVKNDPYVVRGVWGDFRIERYRPAKSFGVTD